MSKSRSTSSWRDEEEFGSERKSSSSRRLGGGRERDDDFKSFRSRRSGHFDDDDDDSDAKDSKGQPKPKQKVRTANHGRDIVFNFRKKMLKATYKDTRTFVRTPCEPGVVIRCYIERTRKLGKNYLNPSYCLCGDLEDGSGKELINCKKILKSSTPHYVFSLREDDLDRKRQQRSRAYLGKLRGISSSEYVMFDSGSVERQDTINPDNIEDEIENEELHDNEPINYAEEDAAYKSQLCSIYYYSKKRPSSGLCMEVCVPTVDPKRPVLGDLRTDLVQCFEKIREEGKQNELYKNKCFVLQEKKSRYDPLSSCLVDFQSRANTASAKNFQLLESTPSRLGERVYAERVRDENIIFQLGKISDDCFNMDFKYPLSMIQAFAIAISRFDANISM